MDLEVLKELYSRERDNAMLCQIKDGFYEQVREYVAGLRASIAGAADHRERDLLESELKNALLVVEALYNQRTAKILGQAAVASAGSAIDTNRMTAAERTVYDSLTATMRECRERNLSGVFR